MGVGVHYGPVGVVGCMEYQEASRKVKTLEIASIRVRG
jgi:hypothetical protein